MDVEKLLEDAGAAWRGAQPAPSVPDTARWKDRRPMSAMSGALAGAAGLSVAAVVISAVVVLVTLPPAPRGPLAADDPSVTAGLTASPRPSLGSSPDRPASPVPSPDGTPSTGPSPSPSAGVDLSELIVRDGDEVVATGVIVVHADGESRFCAWKGLRVRPTEATGPGCGPPSVPVDGYDSDVLPGWTEEVGGGSSGFLRASGRWSDGVFHVGVVEPAEPVEWYPHRPVPCPEQAVGWPGGPGDGVEGESRVLRLADHLEADPDRYSGLWVTYIDPERSLGDDNGVIVVGVVGSDEVVAAEAEALSELYPYNLCVVAASYSAAELVAVEERLGPGEPDWQPNAEPALEAVVLRLPLLDEAAVERIGADAGLVILEPVIAKA